MEWIGMGETEGREEKRTHLHHLGHHLEIVDVERGRQRVDELRFFAGGIAECVRGARPDDDVVALFGVEVDFFFFSVLPLLTTPVLLHLYLTPMHTPILAHSPTYNNNSLPLYILHPRAVESYGALRDQKGLVVHLVPVRRGPGGVRREGELDHSEPVVGVGAIFHDAAREDVADVNDFPCAGGDEGDGVVGI